MMHITFSATTDALLARQKTVTRRNWKPRHANKFKPDDLVAAYDRSPRNGGRRVAVIRITDPPRLESTGSMPPEEWYAEGFEYMQSRGMLVRLHAKESTPAQLWQDWKTNPRSMWVVRFELVEVLSVNLPFLPLIKQTGIAPL
jgi:hypothetical protein